MFNSIQFKFQILRVCLLLIIMITMTDCQVSAGVLELMIQDELGENLPCRILIRPAGKECLAPAGAVTLRIGPDLWFYTDGEEQLCVPAGKILLRVEHGLEFQRFKEEIDIPPSGVRKLITLKRWIDMKKRGYLCAENHLHVDAQTLGPMLIGEGLDFGTSLTWWNGPDSLRPVLPGSGRTRMLKFADRQVESSIYDAELEYGWGAAYIQNLPNPMPLSSEESRPNMDYLEYAVNSGGMVHYQGGWSREVAVDALLGLVHTVNVANNNFHMHRCQMRSVYSNLLEVDGFPVYPDTELGMMFMNTDTYYRLLNWGLHLSAGAGSATGAKEVPVGYNRTYVRVQSKSTLEEFNKSWMAGHNFVSNGPVLFLKIEENNEPGDTIPLPPKGGNVHVEVKAMSDHPLTMLEIVVNGDIVRSFKPSDGCIIKEQVEIEIREGSWIAARCTARDNLLTDKELSVYSVGADSHPRRIRPSRLRYAHTSPIYVTVGGKETAVKKSIKEGLQMLDQFEYYTQHHAEQNYLRSSIDAVQRARKILKMRLNTSAEKK